MRRRQSMQVLELESRVDQLLAENRALNEARTKAEQSLSQKTSSLLADRDDQIDALKRSVEFLNQELSRLTEVNEGLHSAISQTAVQHDDRYRQLQSQHDSTKRELEQTRSVSGASAGATQALLADKDAEISRLRAELESTKQRVRELQRQKLADRPANGDFLTVRDIDYFDHRCQALCSHVQQWVLRFSKFSDMRATDGRPGAGQPRGAASREI
jgi:chromosome segregation ATPase